MNRVTIVLDRKLVDGEILIYKDNKLKSVEVHELLPEIIVFDEELKAIHKEINNLKKTISDLAKLVKEK